MVQAQDTSDIMKHDHASTQQKALNSCNWLDDLIQ